jgi:NDP-sugar pyrophosphorylase family protein
MNIIITLGGKGERFSKNGYKEPKPLIPIFDKCIKV